MCQYEINFSDLSASDRIIGEGWGDCVPFGRWMIGERSVVSLPPPPRRCRSFDVVAVVGPFWPTGRYPSQKILVRVAGTTLLEQTLDNMAELRFSIPGELVSVDRLLEIEFLHPDPVMQADEDGRPQALALSIWTLALVGIDSEIPSEAQFPPGTMSCFHVQSKGNLGNRMILFMLALAVANKAGDCAMSGVDLDEWGRSTGSHVPGWSDLVVGDEQSIDMFSVSQFLATHPGSRVVYRGYGQRMENFLPVDVYKSILTSDLHGVPVFDERFLVINVRSGDVVTGRFADYVLIPVDFYKFIVEATGLSPVFMGQLEANLYTDSLREAFPTALFLETQGPMWDFEVMRRASSLVTSVSTFSWAAAWLSNAKRVYMPVDGILNPLQYPKVDLLPIGDPRYEFFLFPVNHAVPLEDVAAAHEGMKDAWCKISHAKMNEIRMRCA